ncbi:hypothetical protein [Paracoccus sp. PAR01]|uniref:hypothetical protein n=1 Tax=Paracoccus sp. PAR01 TaxID=2769282 RepID=UPI0017825BED|nr:hypothetical protein [Paracoccus sp. PAR01]MBD9526937.1 hypothetical protein [Paracoccus sp. PAR01]
MTALPIPISANVVAAGRAAWQAFKASRPLGLDQLMAMGVALLVGRRWALEAADTDRPVGRPYIAALREWCEAEGFDDLPTSWRMDLLWCAEHEAEVRQAYAAQLATRTKSLPSINPRTLRQSVAKQAAEGAPRKRKGASVANLAIATLCGLVGARLARCEPAEALAEIAALAETLDDAARRNIEVSGLESVR